MQDEDYDADLYETTIEYLTSNGFYQYEVSNFTKDGFECLHNKAYWHHRNYLGLGPSAHSFMNGKRWWNYSSLKRYISEIGKKGNAEAGFEIPGKNELLEEYIMLALRSTGLDLPEVEKEFGKTWFIKNSEFLDELQNSGFITRDRNLIKLTARGYAVCDEILTRFK
jgi:oxygen-independent coproporphyrinogen-3 oxidase